MNLNRNRPIQISYLVASYNHSKYIERCLDSIVADGQGLNFELVILDDGSSDQSAKVIQGWLQKNDGRFPARFISRPNKGVSATFNELIDSSEGDFIRLVASDDMLIPGSTAKMIDLLKQKAGAVAIVGDVSVVDPGDVILEKSRISQLGSGFLRVYANDIKRAIIECWAICGPAAVFRHNYRDIVGKYDERLLIEDWSMFLRLAGVGNLAFIPEAVALYRVHGENTSLTKDRDKRIRNLRSQLVAGIDGLKFYTGPYRLLLFSEVYLLKAKLSYLENHFGWAGLFTLAYIFLKLIARLGLALR